MKFRHVIILLLTCCALIPLKAQQLYFDNITTRNGLTSNDITCVYEDHSGFLWIGTKDGLNRFDGRMFKTFRNVPSNPNSLSGNFIVQVLQDKQGIYWIATKDGGLTRYDAKAPDEKQFTQIRNNPKDSSTIATNRLICLYDWDENYLLVGAEVVPGIFINKKDLSISYWNWQAEGMRPDKADKQPKHNSLNWIHHFETIDDSTFYMSMLTLQAFLKVNKNTGQTVSYNLFNKEAISCPYFITYKNNCWMASWSEGLFKADMHADINGNYPSMRVKGIDDFVTCIALFDTINLLIGTQASGLFIYNIVTGAAKQYKRNMADVHSLASNKIRYIYKDSRGIWWIATGAGLAEYNQWLHKFNETEFAGIDKDFTVFSSNINANGDVTVCSTLGITNLPANGHVSTQKITYQKKELIPTLLTQTPAGQTLIATENSIYKYTDGITEVKPLPVQTDPEKNITPPLYTAGIYQIRDVLADTVNGTPGLWLGILGYGLSFYDLKNTYYYSMYGVAGNNKTLGNNLSHKLAKDIDGNIWLATGEGLYKWAKGNEIGENNFTQYLNNPTDTNSLPHNDVSDIWAAPDGNIWVSTIGGLAMYDGKKFYRYTLTNPSPMFGIQADHHKRIWVITRNGLEVFDMATKQFQHVDVNEPELNSRIALYFSRSENNTIGFTADNKFFSFNPNNFRFDTVYPKIYLADMEVFGKSYLHNALSGKVSLSPKQRFIDFTISALQFTVPENIRFQYMLDGLEETWNTTSTGQIKYTNLSPGQYKLMVRVTNPVGKYSAPVALANFTIATPFYATWWFFTLCVLLIASLAYAFYRYRINQILAMQKVRNKIARDLHDDIGSTLGSISFFSEAAKQLVESSNNAGAEKMLLKIGDTSREMIENMSDIVWSVNPQNDTVKHLTERMRVFAGDLVASSEIQLHFNCDKKVDEMKLSMEQRKNIFLIFKETIYNSVKYAACKNIIVDIVRNDGGLAMKITDDGKGFDVNNYTSKNGNGLKNMKHRAQEVGAVYTIQSSPEKGTVTTLLIT